MKRVLTVGLVGLAALSLAGSHANADNLGVANDFNVFVLGNDSQYGPDAEGRVAVGGTADFTNGGSGGYTVNSHNLSGTGLLVGGAYKNNGTTLNGNIYVNGNATIATPTINGSLYANNSVAFSGGGSFNNGGTINLVTGKSYTHDEGYSPFSSPNMSATAYKVPANAIVAANPAAPIDIAAYFTSASSYLTGHSTGWGALGANGTISLSTNDVTLQHGATNPLLTDIFLVSGTQLQNASSITINANAGYSVLVNVTGLADHTNFFPNINISINGTDKTKVLYNFSQATGGLTLNGLGVQGSVLAPYSNLTFNGGHIDGTLIANNLFNGGSGGGESHDFQFAGNLPAVGAAATPEPGAVALFSAVLISGGALLRRRRK